MSPGEQDLSCRRIVDADRTFRGTKGDNGAKKDLGGAKRVKGEDGKEILEVELVSIMDVVHGDRITYHNTSAHCARGC